MVQTAEAKPVCRAASTVLFPALKFGVKPCRDTRKRIFKTKLSRIAFEQDFANTGGKTLQLDRDEHVDITATARNPLANTATRSRTLSGRPNGRVATASAKHASSSTNAAVRLPSRLRMPRSREPDSCRRERA